MPSFLGKYDEPLTLYIDREIRRIRHADERDNWIIANTSEETGPPSDAAIAAWEAEHPWVEEVEGDDTWWVRYRRCVTEHQRGWLRKMFAKTEQPLPGRYRIVVTDPVANIREQALMSIIDWNLSDDDGVLPYGPHDPEAELAGKTPYPSPLRVSWERLPPHICDVIQGVIAEAEAEPSPAEDKRFPAGGGGSAPVQPVEAPLDRQGVAGGVVVDDLRFAPGPEASGGPAVA